MFPNQLLNLSTHNAIDATKKELERQLKSYLYSLWKRPPLADVTNVSSPKKKRRKAVFQSERTKEDQHKVLAITAEGLIRDKHCRSAYMYLMDIEMKYLQSSL